MTNGTISEAPAPDAEARLRIVRETGRSSLVEASAGTGKTYILIEAILHRVLESTPPLSLARTAALTFTEKAAGEMKIRLRRALERIASSDDPRRDRAEEALRELDRGEVTTIHSFCLALLRERPFEAGIDPDFAQLDPAASTELASRVWNDWWKTEISRRPRGAIAQSLRRGLAVGRVEDEKASSLSQIARALYNERTRLDDARLPRAEVAAMAPLIEWWKAEIRSAIAEARSPAGAAIGYLREILAFLDSLSASDSLDQLADRARSFPGGALHGASTLWAADRKEEIQKFVRKLKDFFEDNDFPEQVRRWPDLVAALDRLIDPEFGYLAAVAAEKRRRNVLDFDDLLLYARDLLRRSATARAHFRRRFEFLAVDEFQDTDPLQMEILLRLSAADGGEADWRSIEPEPGRLFVVGDPKQSIYRFRRADVESYRAAARGLTKETLTASRRSFPEILQWVNGVFGRLLFGDPTRPFEIEYSPLHPWIVRPAPSGERVVYLEPPEGWCEDKDKEIWSSCEAAAVARDISERIASGAVRARDTAILVRSNARVADFQDALDRYRIASVLEGGQEFYERAETAAVVAALKAVSNPHDAVSLYAALKSPLFSFSDEDLLREQLAGVAFRYDRPGPASERLARAFDLFSRLRQERHARSARDTMDDLYSETGAVEIARAGSQGLQAAANLERLAVIAGDLSAAGLSFGSVVRALEGEAGAETGEPRAFEEEEDAVRILTVHKSKGLEFPVVYVTDLGAQSGGKRPIIVFGGNSGMWGTTAAMGGFGVETPGYRLAVRENEERERAEEKRLFYVAATRAKDLLVISCWRKMTRNKSGVISDSRDRGSTNLGRFWDAMKPEQFAGLVAIASPKPTLPPQLEISRLPDAKGAEELEREIAELDERRTRLEADRSLPLRRAGLHDPAEKSLTEDRSREDREPAETPSRAQRIGSAVHEAMQAVVERQLPPNVAANEAGADWELAPPEAAEVRRLVGKLVASDLFRRSASASRRLTELPVLFRDSAGFLVEGKIDLLFEEGGSWVVVDYKTDRWDRAVDRDTLARERYASQLTDYAAAVRALGEGVRVGAAWILSARDGQAIPVPVA